MKFRKLPFHLAWLVLGSSAIAAPPIEALQRSVQQRYGMLYASGYAYPSSPKLVTFPARLDGTAAPVLPPDGFYGGDLDNAAKLSALVGDLENKIVSISKEYFADHEIEGGKAGVKTDRLADVALFPAGWRMDKMIGARLDSSAPIEDRVDWIKNSLRQLKVAYVVCGNYGAEKGQRSGASDTIYGSCGAGDPQAQARWNAAPWVSGSNTTNGYQLAWAEVTRSLKGSASMPQTYTHFRNQKSGMLHELTPYTTAEVTFYARVGKLSLNDNCWGVPSNTPVPADETWHAFDTKGGSGRAVSRILSQEMASSPVSCLLGYGISYNWTTLSTVAKAVGQFDDDWENSCESCACAETGLDSPGLDWQLGLGGANYGPSSARILLQASAMFPRISNPANLAVRFGPGDVLVKDAAGVPLQVRTGTAVVNFAVLSESASRLSQYPLSALGAQQPDGTYAVSGSPVRVVDIRNGSDVNGVVDPNTLEVEVSEDGRLTLTRYRYWPDTGMWEISSGNGARLDLVTTEWNAARTEKTVRRRVYDQAGVKVTEQEVLYRELPFGLAKVSKVVDPAGAALTTLWDYHTDVTQTGKYGRLKSKVEPSGSWETYDYDTRGRQTKVVSSVGDSAFGSADALNRVVTTTYANTNPAVTVVETCQGIEVGRSYKARFLNANRDIQCVKAGAAWDDPSNLVTETRTLTGTIFSGRVASVSHPDGTLTTYGYSRDAAADTETVVTSTGAPNAGKTAVVDGTRTTRVLGRAGQLVSEKVEDIASGLTLTQKTCTEYDGYGQPKTLLYEDGTTETTERGCCGPRSETDRTGAVTLIDYDRLGRRTLESRAGVDLLTTFDPRGQVIETRRKGSDGSEVVLTTASYDLARRLVASTERPVNNGTERRTTTFAETVDTDGHIVKTTTYPDGGTQVETFLKDGRLLKVTGTAANPVRYEYGAQTLSREGVTFGTEFVKEIRLDAAGADTAEVVITHRDMAGRSVRTTTPRESAAGGVALSEIFYNSLGQMARTVDPDGVTVLFTYNASGEPLSEAVDVNRNGAIEETGTDQITRTTRAVAVRDGVTVTRTTQEVSQGGGMVTARVDEVSANGRQRWITQYGQTTSTAVSLMGNGLVKAVSTYPDGSTLEQVVASGRVTSSKRVSAAPAETVSEQTYGYDSFGRLESLTDARTGTTNTAYYSDDQVRSVTTPAPDAGSPRQATAYTYHVNGQKETETLPDQAAVNYSYWPTGALKRQWGARTYPVEYAYDAQGRMVSMTTWQDFAGNTGAATTTWAYDPASGRLVAKRYADNKGPSYAYTPGGRLLTRTWARNIATTYAYNNAGQLAGVDYADSTPDVTLTRDRAGRVMTIADAAGTRTLDYSTDGRLDLETFNTGLFAGAVLDPQFDALSRRTSLALSAGGQSLTSTAYGYDGASRLQTVTRGTLTARYTYETAGGNLVRKTDFSQGAQALMRTDTPHDALNRLQGNTSVWLPQARTVAGIAYRYNAASQRERADLSDGTFWSYGYDALGQVESGRRFWAADNTEVGGQQYGYAFDSIGNRKSATANGRQGTYTANALNQYTSRTVPGAVDVLGEAAADATVSVNGERADRHGAYFSKAATLANSASAFAGNVTVTVVKNGAGPNGQDAAAEEQRPVFVPQSPESFTYDDDGNLLSDGQWTYTWDGENRLIAMESRTGLPAAAKRQKLAFVYDFASRRVQKEVWDWNSTSQSYTRSAQTRFVYDGWNLIAELNGLAGNSLVRAYSWGLDLSGTEQGAGGVGGLLFGSFPQEAGAPTCIYTYDGNGNVAKLINSADGSTAAEYEYGPFGEPIRATGAMAEANSFRFSSKYQDAETKLLYYGCRYYNALEGRWLSRDPIEELGGVNLFSFVGNDGVKGVDLFGMVGSGIVPTGNGWVNGWTGETGTYNGTYNPSAWGLGLDWLTGLAPSNPNFGQNSIIANEMAKSPEAAKARAELTAALAADCKGVLGKTIPFRRDLFKAGYWDNVAYAEDFMNDLKGRNPSRAFMGSFVGAATIIKTDCSQCCATMRFHITNRVGWESGTRLPRWGYKPLSDNSPRPAFSQQNIGMYAWWLVQGRPKSDFIPKSIFPNNNFGPFGRTIDVAVDWEEQVCWGRRK